MKVINSKINKEALFLVDVNSLEDIINTKKIQTVDSYLDAIYLVDLNKIKEKEHNKQEETNLEKDENIENVRVLVLRNKFTNKLSDYPKTIESHLEYVENNVEDPTYVSVEMRVDEYMKVKFKKQQDNGDEKIKITPQEFNIEEKIKSIIDPIDNNETLIISEKKNRVYLPYTIDELEEYARRFPAQYPSLQSVVKREYMLPLNIFSEKPAYARFSETYFLIRRKERKNIIVAFVYAIILVTKKDINPVIIAACKNKKELIEYMNCLKANKLEEFKHFDVLYDQKMSA